MRPPNLRKYCLRPPTPGGTACVRPTSGSTVCVSQTSSGGCLFDSPMLTNEVRYMGSNSTASEQPPEGGCLYPPTPEYPP